MDIELLKQKLAATMPLLLVMMCLSGFGTLGAEFSDNKTLRIWSLVAGAISVLGFIATWFLIIWL